MRASGILMPVSSLPSSYGIGTFGKAAYEFIDFLYGAGQKYWQILPLGPTSYGDSPYQSFSTFAGNPYFIDFLMLTQDNLLKKDEYENIFWGDDEKVDYEILYNNRFCVLRKAFERFDKESIEFIKFCEDNADWVYDYALFMALKNANNGDEWSKWSIELKSRDPKALDEEREKNKDEILFWEFLQFEFYKQWNKLKAYANERDIKIIGDVPIYVAMDSVDVWSNPDNFEIDENYNPIRVAGCPPDGFAPTGQLWGNPLYNWEKMKQDGYKWWTKRLMAAGKLYDVIRIDHFRGFDSYYAIDAKEKTAENGVWEQGVGIDFFKTIEKNLGKTSIIAEDLGYLTPSVKKLLQDSGYPGMKVLEFAFDYSWKSDYLPYNYTKNSVAYTGTHDNDTAIGWFDSLSEGDRDFCMKFLGIDDKKDFVWRFIREVVGSVSDTAIVQMQDYLELSGEGRINKPSTLGGNWQWRAKKDYITNELMEKIKELTKVYGRI